MVDGSEAGMSVAIHTGPKQVSLFLSIGSHGSIVVRPVLIHKQMPMLDYCT